MSDTVTIPAMSFESLEEVRRVIEAFEAGAIPKPDWNHRTHLVVASWYLEHFDEEEARDRVVTGILRYNRLNGIERTRTSGYHETLTLFWLALARGFLKSLPESATSLERINRCVTAYEGKRDLFLEHYRAETIWSWDARRAWTEPDRMPLSESIPR